MRAAEQNLDAFWAATDQNMSSRAGKKLDGTALQKLSAQPRALQRTPEWVEPEKAKKEGVASVDVEAVTKPVSELYFDLEHRAKRTLDRSGRWK